MSTVSDKRLSQDSAYYEDFHTEEELHRYNEGLYAARNRIVLDHLSSMLPEQSHVLDLAAGSWYIAYRLLKDDRVASYTWNDFNPKLVKLVKRRLSDRRFYVDPFDADDSECSLDEFNVFICISLEHIEKDLEIISKLKPGTIISICSPNFDCDGHVRHFESIQDFKSRYETAMSIEQESIFKHGDSGRLKYVITGVKL